MKYETIYHVTTEGDCEGRSTKTLGYATGVVNDIRNFFLNQKTYEIKIEPIKLLFITENSFKEKIELIRRKRILQDQIEQIDKDLEQL